MTVKTPSHDRSSGFRANLDVTETRRQLHMSLGLVTVLSIAIVTAGVTVGGHPLAVKRDHVASRAPVTLMHAETSVVGAKPI